MRTLTSLLRQYAAALRLLLVLTVLLGVGYPLVITLIAQVPGLQHRAHGSLIEDAQGKVVGSRLIGQLFVDKDGAALPAYFQGRPSAAGDGYDPTATSASNLGPESVVDTLPDPGKKGDTGTQSLLTQVCARSHAVGQLEHVDGARPYCTPGGVGAVLAVFSSQPGYTGSISRVVSVNESCTDGSKPFLSTYQGVPVRCGTFGEDDSTARIVPVRGPAAARPVVPADAVTASASGVDPEISPAYAQLQTARVAAARHVSPEQVRSLVAAHTAGRDLGFLGEPKVNVLQLNVDLDRRYPVT